MKRMKRKHRKFLGSVLSLLLLLSMGVTSFAAEPTTPVSPVATTSNELVSTQPIELPSLAPGQIVSEKAITLGDTQLYEVEFTTASGTTDTVVLPRSIYGYAADYTDNTHANFTVNATGSATLTGSATIKSSDFGSSTQITYVSIYRPDGSLAVSNVKLTGNQEKVVSFTNAQPGYYTVVYNVGGVHSGWIHCWIY